MKNTYILFFQIKDIQFGALHCVASFVVTALIARDFAVTMPDCYCHDFSEEIGFLSKAISNNGSFLVRKFQALIKYGALRGGFQESHTCGAFVLHLCATEQMIYGWHDMSHS